MWLSLSRCAGTKNTYLCLGSERLVLSHRQQTLVAHRTFHNLIGPGNMVDGCGEEARSNGMGKTSPSQEE